MTIDHLAVFGGTGDLTARYLLPGLAALAHSGRLPDAFQLTAASRGSWDTTEFRGWAGAQLDRYAADLPQDARHRVVAASAYQQSDVTDPKSVAVAIGGDHPVAAYLALPPAVFGPAVRALDEAELAAGSTIVLEKPFGESLDEAVELNALLSTVVPEDSVFRVDHFLAMTTVQNLLGTRMANRVLEPLWNGTHIAEVDIVWEESLGLEGRAGYYDGVGALKDMLQNHLLQIMCPGGHGAADQPRPARPARPQGRCAALGTPAHCRRRRPANPPGPVRRWGGRRGSPVLAAWAADLVPLTEYPAGQDPAAF